MTELHVLSLGAGVQSTTLYLMFLRGDLKPQIDAAIFADTQEEPAAVYKHLEWLQSLNGPKILVRTVGKLGDDLVAGRNSTGQYFTSIPAFTTNDGGLTHGITRRQCTRDYKTDLVDRTVRRELLNLAPRQRVPKAIMVTRYIGISMDEAGRAQRVVEVFNKQKWCKPVFPLIERFFTRANCLDWLARYGVPHETPRSACVFCPYHSDYEWDRIKQEDPEGWKRAIEVDYSLRANGSLCNRQMDQVMYLHRSCQPLDLVQLDTRPDPRKAQLAINFSVECEGMCGV